MSPPPPPAQPTAEDVFAAFLERIEDGEAVDFEDLCGRHPAAASKLRRIHARWRTMTVAFSRLSQSPPGTARAGDSASLSGLMGKLGSGTRWARYAVGAEIARGAMGRVVTAWDEELRRDVALKVLRAPDDDGRMQRRFVEEAQIAAQLDHPGVVPIHELGLDAEGRPYFAMRLVRGRDLGEVLELVRRGDDAWTRTRVLHVLLRVCETMAYAHHKGVVHRDLKPGNIMVGRFGETYVMDWGLARAFAGTAADAAGAGELDTLRAEIAGEDDVSPLLTRTGDVIGTPAYMAPEQALGGGATTGPLVDVYAIGAILYHLLAGAMPYARQPRPSADAILAAVRLGPPPPLPAEVAPELRAICERAMARLPADRYAGVEALGDDLRAFLELRVVQAHATGGLARLRKWVARNRALAALSAGSAVLLVAGLVALTALWLEADTARDAATATSHRLGVELERSHFRNARLALRSDDAHGSGEALWRHHLTGAMPRATRWALVELAERNPLLASVARTGAGETVFSPPTDSVLLVLADGGIERFRASTLQSQGTLRSAGAQFVSIGAAGGAPVAVAGDRAGAVTVWDLEQGKALRRAQVHRGTVECVEFAADGVGFATADRAGTVLWWRDVDAEPVPLAAIGQRIVSLAIDRAGTRIAVGTVSGHVRCLSTAGESLADLRPLREQVLALSFAPNGRELWAGGSAVHVIDLVDGKPPREIAARNGTIRELLHDTDGSVIAGGWWRIDRYADAQPPTTLALLGVWKMDLDTAAQRVIVKNSGNRFDLVDIAQRDQRRLENGAGAVAMAGDGRSAATFVGQDLVCFDLATGAVAARCRPPRSGWLASNGDGSRVAVVGRGAKGVAVMDPAAGRLLWQADGATETPFHESAAFSPDGRELALVVGDNRIRRHDAADGRLLGELTAPPGRILRLRWSLDGSKLGTIARGRSDVTLFDLGSGRAVEVPFAIALPDGSPAALAALALDHRGDRIAVGTWDGAIAVRDLRDGSVQPLQAHSGTTWSLGFAPHDPGLLISAAGVGGITFWDLDSGEACYQPGRLEAPVSQVQISQDGQTLVCFTQQGPVARDLAYRQRHLAGMLEQALDRLPDRAEVPPGREAALREWAAEVLARPWPRWR